MFFSICPTPSSKETCCFQPSSPLDFGDVRPRAIRFSGPFRYTNDFASAQQFDQTVYGLRIARAEIVNFVHALGRGRQKKGARHIGDEKKIAPLRPVADKSERLARNFLREKNAEHRAVSSRVFERVP